MILASQAIALGTVEALKVLVRVSNTGPPPLTLLGSICFLPLFRLFSPQHLCSLFFLLKYIPYLGDSHRPLNPRTNPN
jgi:hypothetical protein